MFDISLAFWRRRRREKTHFHRVCLLWQNILHEHRPIRKLLREAAMNPIFFCLLLCSDSCSELHTHSVLSVLLLCTSFSDWLSSLSFRIYTVSILNGLNTTTLLQKNPKRYEQRKKSIRRERERFKQTGQEEIGGKQQWNERKKTNSAHIIPQRSNIVVFFNTSASASVSQMCLGQYVCLRFQQFFYSGEGARALKHTHTHTANANVNVNKSSRNWISKNMTFH